MRINNNLMAMNTHRQLGVNTANGAKSSEKLSSGLRINRAADDAAGLSISEKMRGQIRGLNQASRNAMDGISYIQTAEGALNEVSSMLVRMKELGVQTANGTYNSNDTDNIKLEMNQLTTEIGNIINNTKFNGKAVLSSGTTATIVISDDGAQSLVIGGASLGSTTGLTSVATVSEIESAINEVNLQRSTYGAYQNRLESTIRNIDTTSENLQAAESRVRDVDMAKEMMTFTKNNILTQAAQAMLAQANQAPQGVLQLLR